jgi:hypothetical protein
MAETATTVEVRTQCPMCSDRKVFTLDAAGYHRWRRGALALNAFPEIPDDERAVSEIAAAYATGKPPHLLLAGIPAEGGR